jgi:hypothetical protein
MGAHMKTTIELPDALFAQARRFADSHDMTMKSLIEQGLRKFMAEKKKDTPPFKLRDCSVNGNGLTPEFQNATWAQIRDLIYEGHGA